MINIGLLGLGTVGTGVVQIIEERKEYLEELTKQKINISKILVKNIDKKRELEIEREKLTIDATEIIDDDHINIIIEAIGGLDEAYSHIKRALEGGKHVITANKAVVAKHLEELTVLAKEKNVAFLYEASVGGGIPIIKPLKEQTNINKIQEIKGILNGTSNYILTKMVSENLGFQEALKISQKLGYAEADPTDDIKGYDIRRKLRILSTIAFRDEIKEEKIFCQGISSIKTIDIDYIKEMSCTIKLLGKASVKENKYYASVEPVILDSDSYFGRVNDAKNLVSFVGNKVGELRFFGEGAGKFPTANAIISDLVDIAMNTYQKDCCIDGENLINANKLYQGRYYMRITTEECNGHEIEKYIIDNEIVEETIKQDDHVLLITKPIFRDTLEKIIKIFNIKRENCFIAKLEA